MKTIGKILKDARVEKRYSTIRLENLTRIKKDFIEAIEEENWAALPPFPTVLGFVKSLSTTLEIDDHMAVAILKRDYPPKKVSINPKPSVSSKFVWSPRITFFVAVGAVLLTLFGYLGFQYFRFISPPKLEVTSPRPNQIITEQTVLVNGSTDSDVKLIINNQPVEVADDGSFSVNLGVTTSTKEIDIVATARSGKMTEIKRSIEVK